MPSHTIAAIAPQAFRIGDSVRVIALCETGTVAGISIIHGDQLYLVDRPHGKGVIRQHFRADELEIPTCI